MQELPNKQNETFNAFEQTFVTNIQDGSSLLRKEISVNKAEQILLKKRMELMRDFLNDLPSQDPQYSMIAIAIEADKIELDELQMRADLLLQRIEEI